MILPLSRRGVYSRNPTHQLVIFLADRVLIPFNLNRQERAEAAMKSAGASVLTGITLTKLVGVSVLAIAPSLLFRVYYFRMYMATVVAGAFQVIFAGVCHVYGAMRCALRRFYLAFCFVWLPP